MRQHKTRGGARAQEKKWIVLFFVAWFSIALAGWVLMYLWPLIKQYWTVMGDITLIIVGVLMLAAYELSVWPGLVRKAKQLLGGW